MKRGGRYSNLWKVPIEAASVDHFTLHDIRRTAASEVDRVDRKLTVQFCELPIHLFAVQRPSKKTDESRVGRVPQMLPT